MALNKESRSYIFTMAVVLCIACSIVVSGAAVSLRSQQEKNQLLDQRANVLNVVGLYRKGMDVNETFNERIETKVIDLDTGEEVSGVDPAAYDMFKAAKQSGSNVTLSSEQDIAGIGSIPKKAIVYVVRDPQGEVLNYVFPSPATGCGQPCTPMLRCRPTATPLTASPFMTTVRRLAWAARSPIPSGSSNGTARKSTTKMASLPSGW